MTEPGIPNPEKLPELEIPKVEIDVPSFEADKSSEQLNDIKNQVLEMFSGLPDLFSKFFGEYRKPVVTVGLIVAVIITLKVLFAVIAALNEIPLLAPLFELIGIFYGGWFVYRYLLKANTRQELWAEVQSYKEQLFGNKSFGA